MVLAHFVVDVSFFRSTYFGYASRKNETSPRTALKTMRFILLNSVYFVVEVYFFTQRTSMYASRKNRLLLELSSKSKALCFLYSRRDALVFLFHFFSGHDTLSLLMKILILGAKGMLGQELIKAFSDMGEITAWDREDVDITRADETSGKITAFMPDILINAAAYNNMDKAESEDAEIAKTINGNVVGALADICQILAITMVHYSTDYVFDGTKGSPYIEADEPNPESVYATSKYLGERLLKMSGTEYYLLRTSRLFGNAGSSEMAKRSFVDTMLEKAKTQQEFQLVSDEVASPTYVKDLALQTRKMFDEKKPFGLYHVTNSGECSWYEFGKKVFELAGLHPTVTAVPGDTFPRPAKRPAYSVLKSTKLPPLRSWEDALKDYLANRT